MFVPESRSVCRLTRRRIDFIGARRRLPLLFISCWGVSKSPTWTLHDLGTRYNKCFAHGSDDAE
eukprot:1774669-Pleurochrysis_carterae.AAC.1